jgi:hypothetical protein
MTDIHHPEGELNVADGMCPICLAAEIERLRAALKWLRPYVAGTSVYGKVHALDKIDAALEQKSP